MYFYLNVQVKAIYWKEENDFYMKFLVFFFERSFEKSPFSRQSIYCARNQFVQVIVYKNDMLWQYDSSFNLFCTWRFMRRNIIKKSWSNTVLNRLVFRLFSRFVFVFYLVRCPQVYEWNCNCELHRKNASEWIVSIGKGHPINVVIVMNTFCLERRKKFKSNMY